MTSTISGAVPLSLQLSSQANKTKQAWIFLLYFHYYLRSVVSDHSHFHLNNQQFKDIMCIIGSCLFITTDTDLLQTNKMTNSQ